MVESDHMILIMTSILSELYIFLMPEKAATEANLSLVWVILVILFTYKLLLSLNGLYFEGEPTLYTHETCLVM